MEALLGMNQGNFLCHVLDYISCKCLLILPLTYSRNFSLWVATGEISQTKAEAAVLLDRPTLDTCIYLNKYCFMMAE